MCELLTPCVYYLPPNEAKYNTPTKTYKLDQNLFSIITPYNSSTKTKWNNLSETASLVQSLYSQINKSHFPKLTKKAKENGNEVAIETASRFYKLNDFPFPNFRGENKSDFAVVSFIQGIDKKHEFIFPVNSVFICGDLFSIDFTPFKFDFIVMDPPWKNKFIRRRKRTLGQAGYFHVDSEEFSKLKIDEILEENGILAVWCTNSKTHLDHLKNTLFQKWNVNFIAQWFWLKTTIEGNPICPFNKENGKQPFETLLLAQKTEKQNNCTKPQDTKLMISTPSAINSQKPELTFVLEKHFNRKFSKKCELFARYLLPNYTSFGNQVIKLQHVSLYTCQENQ